MSRNYFDIPLEIRDKVKERVIEAGNEYDEKFIVSWYNKNKTIPGSSNNGFTYNSSTEGMNFWVDVIISGNHHVFFEKYPERYALEPKFKVGQKVRVLKNDFNKNRDCIGKICTVWDQSGADYLNAGKSATLAYNGQSNYFSVNFEPEWLEIVNDDEIMNRQVSDFRSQAYPKEKVGTKYLCLNGEFEGKEVTLSINDKSSCPYFHIEEDTDRNRVISWCDLKRIDSCKLSPEQKSRIGFVPIPEIGNYRIKTLEECGGKRPGDWNSSGKMDYLYGHVLTAKEEKEYLKGNSPFNVEHWTIRSEDVVKVNNLNLNIQQNGSKESNTVELVLSRISATISYGSAPRGVELQSTRSKIQLGS